MARPNKRLDELRDIIAAKYRRSGMAAEASMALAREAVAAISEQYGGDRIYIPGSSESRSQSCRAS